jgi:hypothetical protein
MSTERVAAIILLVGSVLFIIAAFLPVSQVFAEPSPAAAKLEIITSNPTALSTAQLLFGLGASIAAIGLGLVAYHLRGMPGAVWAYVVGLAAVILGVVFWDGHVYLRAVDPEGFVEGGADRLAVCGVCATYAGGLASLRRLVPAGGVSGLARRHRGCRSGYLLHRLLRLERHSPAFLLYPDVHHRDQAHAMRSKTTGGNCFEESRVV